MALPTKPNKDDVDLVRSVRVQSAVSPAVAASQPLSNDATTAPTAERQAKGASSADTGTRLPKSGYLTAEWVKRRYSISNSTLYKWRADTRDGGGTGFPAPVRIGPRAVRWRAEDLAVFENRFSEGG